MPPAKQRGQFRGILFPGYRYLGPFNPLDNGEPVNKADEAAKRHDLAYNQYLNKGLNPYLKFNKADQQLIDDLSDDSSLGGKFARGVFSIKRALAPSLNEKQLAPGRSAEQKQARKLYFARSNKGAKRQRLNPPTDKPTSNPDNPNMETEQPMEEEAAPQEAAAGSRAGAGGGPANAGSGGVGMSTGQWIGGSIITPNKFVTRNTRQWWCDIKNDHMYKRYDTGTGARLYGFSTPWSYFNFNQYNGHFSPKEWQTLLNIASRFRPVRMQVKIYNIQIKQIVDNTSSGDTLYQNDLTAGLHIFCDGEHAFPYTQNPWDRGTMPELPTEPWELQQYAYITCPYEAIDDPSTNAFEEDCLAQEPFYMLESADHMIVRTGEAVQFHHEFSCGWVDNTRSAQTPAMMSMNPMVLSKEVFRATTGGSNHDVLARQNQKTGYWSGGPGRNHNNTVVPSNGELKYTIASRLSNYAYSGITASETAGISTLLESGINTGPPTGSLPQLTEKDKILFCPKDHPSADHAFPIQDSNTGTRNNETYFASSNGSTFEKANPVWMMPNQAWDSCRITRYNPIWVKTPRVDRMTMVDTRDGTLPMSHPPGTIYMKLANIPVPSTHPESYLRIYATGNVSVEIEWEYETHFNKNWRPEFRITPENIMSNAIYKVDTNGAYRWPNNTQEAMGTRYGLEKVL
uniref:Minor capsid protein VP1 n=2 Tax=Dromedary camel bocaparvovirus 1 TaxID=2014603 RepID=A0A1Z3FVR7_9VIRU|nr:VP1 [Dromedary camel bocaparvovirus 1]